MRQRYWLVGDGIVILGCSHRYRLRRIPIICRERQPCLLDRNVGVIWHLYGDRYVCGRFGVQHHRVALGIAFCDRQCRLRHRSPWRVVFGGRHCDSCRHALVVAAADGVRQRHWLVGDGIVILGCGYRDRLRCIPIICRERQFGLLDRNVGVIWHLYCDRYVCGRFGVQHYCVLSSLAFCDF